MPIFLLELFSILLIAYGLFLIAIPLGLIFVGLSVLLFTAAYERGRGKAK
jgi:uncharacterized membrane protein